METAGVNQLPAAFLERIRGQLGEELPDFLRACKEPYLRGIRFHPLRKTDGLMTEDLLERIPWAENAYQLRQDSAAGIDAAHEAGAFYLQEPSAMIPAAVMDARPGEKILDLCAAPGGKSTQLGCALRGEGLLVANEPVPKRAQILSRNIERMGIPNAVVTCAMPSVLAARFTGLFDGVMVDAPCSGEGMFRRHPETRAEWTAEKARGCVIRQEEILEEAAKMVRPGGRLVYATCTFNPSENEEQMERFIRRHPEFVPDPFSLPGAESAGGMLTCWPHRMRGEGQFTARLRKTGGNGPEECSGGEKRKSRGRTAGGKGREAKGLLSREERRILENSGLMMPEITGRLGSSLVSLPGAPDLSGLRVLRMGLHVGEIRSGVLIPDHALALSMFPPDAPDMELSGEEALRYLAGESLEGEQKGWVLMKYGGLVLGWGKGSEGRIRNHYPKGLRNALLTVSNMRKG